MWLTLLMGVVLFLAGMLALRERAEGWLMGSAAFSTQGYFVDLCDLCALFRLATVKHDESELLLQR
jgi:hypothetical protein